MGYNTVFLLHNDQLTDIELEQQKFGEAIVLATKQACMKDKPFALKGFSGACQLIQQEHADNLGIIALGGNTIAHLGFVQTRNRGDDESKLAIIRQLASSMGYELRRRPVRRK